ncbi:MAG TPA: hypothetical protein VGX03_20230 [Candidatus Binatia bacterium]|nr:hypothetical protein [Candidatus Binatia bacterium]
MIPSLSPDQSNTRPTIFTRWGSGTGLAAAILCGIVLAFYHGLWLPGLVLIKRDAFRYFLPLKQYVTDRLSAGELPHWFPYEALGWPLSGIGGIGIFHPFTALYFLLSVPDAYRASTLFSCLLAALGAFALGRTLTLSRTGALLAGVVFALSGYVASLTDNVLYLYSVCVLPLFCAALEKALTEQRAWVVAPAAVWATVFLNDDVQTGYYYIFIALAWCLARAPRSRLDACLRLMLIGCLTALLAGIQLGPAWAVFVGTERVHPAQFHDQALSQATHPLRLMTIVASPVGEGLNLAQVARSFFGSLDYGSWAESLYLGVPVMGLALLGAWHRRDLRVLALLGVFAVLLALGRYGGLYEIFYQTVPLWSAFRYPEKLMGVASFAAAMLAGAGLDVLRARQGRLLPWFGAAILCVSAGLILHTHAATLWAVTTFGVREALFQEVARTAAPAFLFSAVAALGVGLVVARISRGTLRLELLLAVIIVLVALDLSRANQGAYYTGPREMATFTPPLAEALAAREGTLGAGRFRLVTFVERLVAFPEQLEGAIGHYAAGITARRQALATLHNAEFHIETAKPYLPANKPELVAMLQQGIGAQVAARYNVSYYIGLRSSLKDPLLVNAIVAELPDYDLALFRNPFPAKSRAYLSRHPERAVSPVDPVALMARSDFLNGEVDVIETSAAQLPEPAHEGTATIEHYAPEDVRVRVDTPQPAVLILLDSFDKGWTATLESGMTIPILRANALVRAVVVPAGTHVVTFSYQTPLLMAGALASLAGVLLCIGLLTHARWRTRSARDCV